MTFLFMHFILINILTKFSQICIAFQAALKNMFGLTKNLIEKIIAVFNIIDSQRTQIGFATRLKSDTKWPKEKPDNDGVKF